MTISVLRPSSDIKKVGVLYSTGTTAWSLLDDGGAVTDYTGADDNTYIRAAAGTQWPNALIHMGLTDLGALATNQRIKQLRIRGRFRMNSSVPGDAAIVHTWLTDPQSGLGFMPVGTSVESTPISKFVTGSATVVAKTGAWYTKPPPSDGEEWTRNQVNRSYLGMLWYYGDFGTENLRATELYVDVDVRTRPTVSGVTSTGHDASTRPIISWNYNPNADGDPQVAFQVKVFSSTQYGAASFDVDDSLATWNTGVRFGSGEQDQVGVDLANGGVYKAYVRSAQDFNGDRWWTDWAASSAFTVGLTPPPAPTLTVTSDPSVPNLRNLLQYTATLNALGYDDADLEGSAGNWGAVSATVTRSTAQARHGAASLAVTAAGGSIPFAITDGNGGAGAIAVRPGQQFTGTGYVRAATTTRAWRMVLRWTDAAHTYLSQNNGATVTDSNSAWTQLPAVTATAPANAVHLYAQIETTTTPGAGEVHYFDQFQIVPGASAPAWSPGFLATSFAVIEAAVATTDPRNLAGRQLYGGGDDTRDASGFYTTGTTSAVAFDMLDRVRGLGSIRWEVEDTTSKLYFGWPSGTLADPSPAYALAAVPGRTYTFSVYARTTGSSFSSQLNLQAIDATGATVGSPTNGGAVTIGTAGWARYTASITVPAGAVYVRPHLDNTASVTGRKVWVDGAQWELGSAVTDLTRPGGQALNWVPVRGFTVGKTPVPDGLQSLAAFDHEVPPGHTVIYRAWIYASDPISGQALSSPLTAYVPTLIDPPGSGQWVLSEVSPAPFLRGKVSVLGGRSYSQAEDATAYHPLRPKEPGQVGQRPVVLSDWIGGRDGSLQLASLSDDDFWLLEHLMEIQDPLWLAESQGGGRYIRLMDRNWTETRFRNKCVNLADGTVLQANEYEHVLTLGYVNAERPPDNEAAVTLVLDPSGTVGGGGEPEPGTGPYDRLTGIFIDTNEHLQLTDGTVPADKYAHIVVHWYIGPTALAAIKAVHPAATIYVYQNVAAMIAGPHVTVGGVERPTTLVTQEEGWTHNAAADLALGNGFEEPSAGTTIAAGQGPTGNEWDFNFINGAGSTLTADTTRFYKGAKAAKAVVTAGSTNALCRWASKIGSRSTLYHRVWVNQDTLPGGSGQVWLNNTSDAGSAVIGPAITPAGQLIIRNGLDTTTLKTFTNTVPVDSWFRLEWKVTAAGAYEVRLYLNPDSLDPTETQSGTDGTAQAALNSASFCIDRASAGITGWTAWFDSPAVSSSTWLGTTTGVGDRNGTDNWFVHTETPAAVTVTSSTNVTPPVFTTGAAHGLSLTEAASGTRDWVEIRGHSVASYNGFWEVNTVPSTTTVTFRNAAGTPMAAAGAGSGGTIRKVVRFCSFSFLHAANIDKASYQAQAANHLAQIAADFNTAGIPAGQRGVFLDDANMKPGHCFNEGDANDSVEFASNNDYRDAMRAAIAALAPSIRGQGLAVLPNIVGSDPWVVNEYAGVQGLFTDGSVDGVYYEFYGNWWNAASPQVGEEWFNITKIQGDAEAAGVFFAGGRATLSPADDTRAIRYVSASFWLHWDGSADSGAAYFGGRPLSAYGNYRNLIGTPLEAKQLVSGTASDTSPWGAWMRHYSGGVVCVNAKSTAGLVTFTLGGTYLDPTGASVTSVQLDSGHGMVLLTP